MKTCLIIPCYNEADRLDGDQFVKFVQDFPNIHFLFVNDGSKDSTKSLLEELAKNQNIETISLENNSGKAEAIRKGSLHALDQPFDYLGYWDADLATPLKEIFRFILILEEEKQIELVTGMRLLRLGAFVRRKSSRHYLGRIFATFVSFILSLPVYDTQCGAKLFKRKVAKEVFKSPFISPWFFDVEILFRIQRKWPFDFHRPNIFELPLNKWEDIGGSKLHFLDFLKAPFEILKIYIHYKA